MNKYKLINDPVHGFITISSPLMFQIIEHPYFQRLRRISQMGFAKFVYPGTQHTRFHHALGAMHLMQKAIQTLRQKNVEITNEEEEAVLLAILLHDIGHGPYSHALEYVMTEGINHEFFSEQLMRVLNRELNGKLDLTIQIFNDEYPKHFLHQLVSSQLDVDRLDYLARDSFFSGVNEGKLSTERIITMLDVVDGQLVVEQKGLYSIEKYIISRRLMYWQVYLHKTAVCAEGMLVLAIQRAKHLVSKQQLSVSSKALNYFLEHSITREQFQENLEFINLYAQLDDYDVMFSIKEWQYSSDAILSYLCKCIIQRKLFKVQIEDRPFSKEYLTSKRNEVKALFQVSEDDLDYLFLSKVLKNLAYKKGNKGIKILTKKNQIKDVAELSDHLSNKILQKKVKKYLIAYPYKN